MQTEIAETVKRQKEFFKSGETLSVKTRLLYLKKLYKAIKDNLEEIHDRSEERRVGKEC